MAKSINKIFLQGNVGADPDIRDVSGTKVAQFNLATSNGGFTKRDGTQVPEKTQWHRIVAWRGMAEVSAFIHKGDKVTVIGSVEYRTYEKDGIQRQVTEIIAEEIVLGSNQAQTQAQAPYPQQGYQPQGGYAPNQGYPQGGYAPNQGYQPPMPQGGYAPTPDPFAPNNNPDRPF